MHGLPSQQAVFNTVWTGNALPLRIAPRTAPCRFAQPPKSSPTVIRCWERFRAFPVAVLSSHACKRGNTSKRRFMFSPYPAKMTPCCPHISHMHFLKQTGSFRPCKLFGRLSPTFRIRRIFSQAALCLTGLGCLRHKLACHVCFPACCRLTHQAWKKK